jgi:uncharacterized caspase-like protein
MNRMTALVIGNASYQEAGELKNPANDAEDFAEKLRRSGFAVTLLLDASYKDMDKALNEFRKAAKDGNVALFFFAGHGVQIDGDNYLAASDTVLRTKPRRSTRHYRSTR